MRRKKTTTLSLPAYDDGNLPIARIEHFLRIAQDILPDSSYDARVQLSDGLYVPIMFPNKEQAAFGMQIMAALIEAHGHDSTKCLFSCFEGIPTNNGTYPSILAGEKVMQDILAKEASTGRGR